MNGSSKICEISQNEIKSPPSGAPSDSHMIQDAVMAGQNHGILETLQTVQKLIEGEDISSQAADQMLAFPETRAVAEELAGINFSGELPARALLHAWQKIHRADLEQAVWKSHESKQLNKPREEMPDSEDAFFELLRELPDPDGSFKQALESHRLKKLAEEFAENAQQIQDGSLTARELALQMVENGEKGGPSAQTYKKALLSKLERVGASETPYDVPLYRRAAGIHRVIADNLQNLQRQQIAEAAQRLNSISNWEYGNGSQGLNRILHANGDLSSQTDEKTDARSFQKSDSVQSQQEVPSYQQITPEENKKMAQFRKPDATFDLEGAKKYYESFLQNVPEQFKIYLQQSLDAVEFQMTDDPGVVLAFDGRDGHDEFLYNPQHPLFNEL